MVNPQLVTYCESQMKLGATKEEIKNALVGAGWPAADVDDSLNSAGASQERSIPAQAAQLQKAAPAAISVSDLISNSSITVAPVKVKTAPADGKPKADPAKKSIAMPKFHASVILLIVLGLVAAGCAGGVVYFYMQNKTLQDKVSLLAKTSDTTTGKIADLNSQVATLTKSQDDLKSQVAALMDTNKGLSDELSLFAVPAASSASGTAELAIDFKGTLGGGGKALYTIVNADGVKASVKNSKDPKVDAVLSLSVGKDIEIAGTHPWGSNSVTVTSVNGASVQ